MAVIWEIMFIVDISLWEIIVFSHHVPGFLNWQF